MLAPGVPDREPFGALLEGCPDRCPLTVPTAARGALRNEPGAAAHLVRPSDVRRVTRSMSPKIRPGARVLVPHDRHRPCTRHMLHSVTLFQQVGVVDRIDA